MQDTAHTLMGRNQNKGKREQTQAKEMKKQSQAYVTHAGHTGDYSEFF